MPSYEFICRQCQERFTVLIPYKQKNQVRCPHCKSDNLRELFGLGWIGGSSKGSTATGGNCSSG
jgi:putative FmdB family regulatory protein